MKIKIDDFSTESAQFFTRQEIKEMESHSLFYFNHKFGFTVNQFLNNRISEEYKIVAEAYLDPLRVVVWVENQIYPFFGTQFHPEKITLKNFKNKGDKFYEFYIN